MKKLSFLILILGIAISNSAQKSNSKNQFLGFSKEFTLIKKTESNSSFYISSKPITNREYIVYLLWIQSVYSYYPAVLTNAIPRTDRILTFDNPESRNNSLLRNLINGLVDKDREYVFNSKYIDYPIVGLSFKQAMEFAKWLSDRYNEYVLIKKKYYQLDLFQQNENCFNTEAFFAGQYMGLMDDNFKEVQWSDGILIPSFRLPTNSELVSSKAKISNEMKPYEKFTFLQPWHFESREKDTIILSFGNIDDRNFVKLLPLANDKLESNTELTLDSYETVATDSYKILESIGLKRVSYESEHQLRKDSIGRMPYYIIGEDSKKEIIAVKNFSVLKNDKYLFSEKKIFRVVVNTPY